MSLKAVLATLTLLSFSAMAAGPAEKSPIKITADNVVVDQKSLSSVYSGNVELEQGAMRLSAEQLKVFTENKRLQRLEASGSPARLNTRGNDGEVVKGEASRIDYFAKSGEVVFIGRAKLIQADNTIESDNIRYDLNKGTLTAGGEKSGGRVEVILLPAE